jgi:hypothetical protein
LIANRGIITAKIANESANKDSKLSFCCCIRGGGHSALEGDSISIKCTLYHHGLYYTLMHCIIIIRFLRVYCSGYYYISAINEMI